MNLHHLLFSISTACAASVISAVAEEPAPPALSATDLAARLSSLQQDGSSYVRLRLEVKQAPNATKLALQIQIKQRRTRTTTEVVYQILWPKERQGEAVLLRKTSNQAASGSLFVPPDTVQPIDSSQMKNPLFGSDLSYADILENFFAWESQSIIGKEVVDHVNCLVLESKPGKGQRSIYTSVRSWVDPVRLVPLRVEKYLAPGRLGCRVDCSRVVREDDGRHIPANLTVRGLQRNSITELDGSRLKHDVTFSDQEFTPDGLKNISPPRTIPP